MIVEITCVGELANDDGYKALIDEYEHYKIPGLTPVKSKYLHDDHSWSEYGRLENLGVLTIYRARHDGRTVGIITIVDNGTSENPFNISFVESLYVMKSYRRYRAAAMLKKAAEDHAIGRKSWGILIGLPPDSPFSKVLQRSEYILQSQMWMRKL